MWTFWIEFALLLTAILIGIRRGGVALGMIGGLGVAVLAFVFRVAPAEPPITVMLIILAVVTASATLQVAGGLDFLVQQAEKVMRKHPQQITFLAPMSTFLLTMCVGTGHAVYSLLPVIADVSLKTKIRPERPMAMASVASQMGITASPAAAAVTSLLAMTAHSSQPLTLWQILMVTIPAGLIGVVAAAFWSLKRGAELAQDPEYQARLQDPEFRASIENP
ncbi:anaerobic C4-dicarboxylate transporter family protein [Chromobacterium vaccinii]|uniref:anaerobic C4-dicarboxylate transporter family protein n=1 Tax=Chromobacterium vaccinii TaxID=1108595 RepID=UPI000E1A5297|nr:anaerobic C4-dicarboxylate transporter family protein [Chromobacterium vaccinii]SUX55628.1 Anaerobic C4-dicarboxylate transporter DcuB [Chromobacterium vaccinii]